jgi:hypothetical protein
MIDYGSDQTILGSLKASMFQLRFRLLNIEWEKPRFDEPYDMIRCCLSLDRWDREHMPDGVN